ncbi:GNAT family N-acetyltransferase [Rhodoferax lacus]|uniref:GNAT family N-acetyltransferase n=1 Tax=Rhodoferax lacus TaxID=2184758 RepID=A0A3E1RED6_9BURK|nr:GNAT family N-acetyltransferase [Rhodoferax lacus]RFO96960.1 GNAT family N-acetyltransferase [Rhodoferax lacus]
MSNTISDGIRICRADYANPRHATALVSLLDAYARDPMGGGEALSDFAKANVVSELAKLPYAFSLLAFDGEGDDAPVGLANCILGFSTFACKPLVNVHDLTVAAASRGRRIGERLLVEVERVARAHGACKITLEVLSNNPALRLYVRSGFAQYQLDPAAGQASFMQKWLD